MNLKEYIKHFKSICKQGILRHKNVILDETFQKELLEIIKCYDQLEQDNQSLKRQLENKYSKTGILTNEVLYEENTKLINQQKEFIEYLEKTIIDSKAGNGQQYYYQQVLEMYKEIIGGKDE